MMVIGCVLKNWLGDVVFSSTAIRVIRNNFPTAKIVCLAPKRCAEILKVNPYIDQVITFDERGEQRGIFAKLKLIGTLRKLKFDQVYLFHRSFTRALIIFLSGAKKRIGYKTKGRGFLLTSAITEPKEKMHSVDLTLELTRRSGLQVTTDALYETYFQKSDLEKAKQLISKKGGGNGRLVAINPGANWPPKRWPVERFVELARELTRTYDVQVGITGGAEDRVLGETIVSNARDPRVFSICGETNLNELAAFFSLCSLAVSSDSGPLHIAGGVGTNVIGIFGPTDPEMTGPRGRGKNIVIHYVPKGEEVPWYGRKFPKSGWLEHISVKEVLQTIAHEKLL